MKLSNKWMSIILVPVIAACGNQGNQLNNELAAPVSVIDVTKGPIVQFINTTGTAEAASQVVITSEMAGEYYLGRNPRTGTTFKLGDIVEKGQVIVKFENAEYVNSNSLETKKLNFEISDLEYQKQKSLYDKGGVTFRELKNSEVSLAQAKLNYENALIQLGKMEVKALFRGVIVDLPHVTDGTRVNSGTAIVTLMDYSKLMMDVNLPEKFLSTIKIGQEVSITNYTIPNDTLKAQINELSPVVSTETRTFKGKMLINNTEMKLRPGMFVKADIEIARKDTAIVIPKDIIVAGSRGKTVYIVDKGAAQRRTITTGLENETSVEVTEGLKVNDRLVIKGYETLRDHSKVKIIK
jgi:membrane fusion protein, multidrug efflux system